MGKERLDPLNTVNFHCRACGHRFEAEPDKISDAPDLEHHPFEYEATCPECGSLAPQIAWERNVLKAHACSTGPKTKEGKAASAKNLEGHPTPAEAQLTKFNAMKTGLYARTATYFPARPGKYDRCDNCEHLESEACLDPPRACLKRHELLLKNQIAFETNDPTMLRQIRSDTQAALQSLIDDMILAIAQDGGPRIKELVWHGDKDGGINWVKYKDDNGNEFQLEEIKAHPLLKPLIDFISKNSMTLSDLGMTPKMQDEHEQVQGFLDREADSQQSEDDFRQQTLEGQRRLEQLIGNSYSQREPVTVEGELVDE